VVTGEDISVCLIIYTSLSFNPLFVNANGWLQTPEEAKIEIENYDMKVYKASVEMAKALDSELRHLGTPFFAIRQELVGSGAISEGTGDKPPTIPKEQLVKLQHRMLGLLEDLCKE
jgi:hypothetical protein